MSIHELLSLCCCRLGDIALSRWSGICSHRGGAPECVYCRETMASMIVLIGIKGLSDILHRARILSVVTQPKKFPQKSHGHLVKTKCFIHNSLLGSFCALDS